MTTPRRIAALLLLNLCCPSLVRAALPIDLEVATEPGVPLTAPQQWARLLGTMDLGSVRIRGIRAGDRPQVEDRSQGGIARYRLTAVLNKRNELQFPRRKFRATEAKALRKYLEELPTDVAHNAEERGRFGLTEKQFRQIYAEFSPPIGFSTAGSTAPEVLARIEETLASPLQRAGAVQQKAKPLAMELEKFSTGTGLAIALRTMGLAMYPEQPPGEPLRVRIARYDAKQESWPTGWKPAVSVRASAPQLFVSRNIELNGFTLSQALTALDPALKMPVVLDAWIVEQAQIEPSKIQVSLPKKKTFLKSAVGKLASQARLVAEVRVDEQEQPFIWLTRFGKNSLPAVE